MGKKVIIIGAGGHSKVIVDIIIKVEDTILGFVDDNIPNVKVPFNYPLLGTIKSIPKLIEKYSDAQFFIAIGDNDIRKKIADSFSLTYYTAIHPNSSIGVDVEIGEGTCVMSNAVINPSTKIGKHCIINSGAVIEHDNIISDFVHISPSAALGGGVIIHELTHVGIGSVIKNNVLIKSNITIGAGAVVVKNLVENGIYIGVPASRKNSAKI